MKGKTFYRLQIFPKRFMSINLNYCWANKNIHEIQLMTTEFKVIN